MAKFIRYAVAVVFFAASIGCLALWFSGKSIHATYISYKSTYEFVSECGFATVATYDTTAQRKYGLRRFDVGEEPTELWFADEVEQRGEFGRFLDMTYFPLWYPALACAAAGVGVLRFRRQFSIRSALVTMSVVAALLGMVVAL